MRAATLLLAAMLLLSPITSLSASDDACDSEHAALQQETAQLNDAVAQFNNDCGQVSPDDYAAKGCAQRAAQLEEWRNTLHRKILDHNTRCGG